MASSEVVITIRMHNVWLVSLGIHLATLLRSQKIADWFVCSFLWYSIDGVPGWRRVYG